MLTGRESLVRVIGKRRRFLPNLPRLLSHSSLNLANNQNETELNDNTSTSAVKTARSIDHNSPSPSSSTAVGAAESVFVDCPVCGSKIAGDDYTVNSHLDVCLVRGTKRKLSQRTLLQFSFCSRLKRKPGDDNGIHVASDDIAVDSKSDATQNCFPQLAGLGSNEVPYDNSEDQLARGHNSSPSESPLASRSVTQRDGDHVMGKSSIEDRINNVVDTSPVPHRSIWPNFDMEGVLGVLSGTVLETYIVGRRYCEGVEIISGSSISLVRDPINAKDPNAIKILMALKL